MNKKNIITNCKVFISFLILILCFAFTSCDDSGGNNGYKNPNSGSSRSVTFSHNSGIYNNSFNLTLKTIQGNTIYYSTDGSIPYPEKAGTNKYSSSINIVNRNGQANVLAANWFYFYGDVNDDRGHMPVPYEPSNAQVPKATVIRAVSIDSSGKRSTVETRTYFIGNNLDDTGNVRIISLVSDPEGLVSDDTGIMVRGHMSNTWNGPNIYNFLQRGRDEWERQAYIQIFDGNGKNRNILPIDGQEGAGVGIRVRGGWSRAVGQKSFSVFFRSEHDNNDINNLRNTNLIPGAVAGDGSTMYRYKSFMLRNGGNDVEYTKFYDIFLQKLLSDRSFTTQMAVPAILYLNGEYWGPYNIQERYSNQYLNYKYGVSSDNVIIISNGELDEGPSSGKTAYDNMMNMRYNNMSVPANYTDFCNVFDIDNFIDYWASQIYIYNEDWPHNNNQLWRTASKVSGNAYGDNKWRYQMYDVEYALGIYRGGNAGDAIDRILNGENKEHEQNELFASLLANDDFCKQFVNTMMDLYNVNFHPDKWQPLLNEYENVYRPLMGDSTKGYFSRWGYPNHNTSPWMSVFENKVSDARNYLNNIRSEITNNYLPEHFGSIAASNSLRDVTLSTEGVSGATIKIDSISPKFTGNSWTGQYYAGIPVKVKASAAPAGFEFDKWVITGGTADTPTAIETTVNFTTGSVTIMALYKPIGSSIIPVTGITLSGNSTYNWRLDNTVTLTATVTPSNATYRTVIWSSNNTSVATVVNGKITAVGGGTATITVTTAEGAHSATCTINVEAPQTVVLLDMAEHIKNMSPRPFDSHWYISGDDTNFNYTFWDIPLRPATGTDDVKYELVNDGGVRKLKISNYVLWSPGVHIDLGDFTEYQFRVGDMIEIKGSFNKTRSDNFESTLIQLNSNTGAWFHFQGWETGYGNFHKTFTLTQHDINNIVGEKIRISTSGISPYDGYASDGEPIAIFYLEQVKVYRVGYFN